MDLTDKRYRQDFWKGTSQFSRLLDELEPSYVQVDELSANELIKFTDEYAKHIIFHKRTHEPLQHQHWQEFFKKDSLYLLFYISNTELTGTKKDFTALLESAYHSGEHESRQKKYKLLLNTLQKMVDDIFEWHQEIEHNEYTVDLVTNLTSIIRKELVDSRQEIQQITKKLTDTSPEVILYSATDPLDIIGHHFNKLFSVLEYVSKESKNVLLKILEGKRDNKSYITLFIAFLQLYKRAQGEINQITRKHLEFYYTQVLRQTPNDTLPDKAYVCASLAKGIEYKLLNKGILFDAGKAADGKNIYYQLQEDATMTDLQIKQIHTLFVSRNKLNYSADPQSITDIFYHKNLSPADRPPGWATFGEDQFFYGPENKTMDHAPIGFVIASDALRLSEGNRNVLITLECESNSYQHFKELITRIAQEAKDSEADTFERIFTTAFDFYISLDGTETRSEKFSVVDIPENSGIGIQFTLSAEDGPLAAPPINEITQPIPLKKPFVKILLRSESHIYAYPLVNALSLKNTTIDVAAGGVNNLTLYNDLGPINSILPFAPFGLMPGVGSSFYIGSNEIFSKRITHLSLRGRWTRLPQNDHGWKGYFCGYDTDIENKDYQAAVSYLSKGSWHPMANKQKFPLFEEVYEHDNPNPKLSETIHFQPIDTAKLSLAPYKTDELNLFSNKTTDGYIKLEFISPVFAFGHASYAKRLSEVASHNANLKKDEDAQPWPDPAMPFTPLMDRFSIDYKASVSSFEDDKPTHEIDLYRITPFGYRANSLKSHTETECLLEPFDDEGNLYLGLDKYPQNGYLNLFFHLMEGRVEDYLRDIPTPKWQYLANNTWEDFEPGNVISDTTNSFIRSGIIRLQIPSDIQKGNTLLDENLFWIKVSIRRDSEVAAGVNGIYTNALTVQWNEEGDKKHLEKPLPPYSIKKLKEKMPEIAGILQPIASTEGKKIEQTNFFYQRVSERLRHKHRAVNVWDYERLVLNQFPIIHRVKCFTANTLYTTAKNEAEKKHAVKPGSLKIVVIPDIYSPQVRNMLRPKVGINHLKAIQCYLQEIASSFSDIEVSNPFYERVKVIASVKFKSDGKDEGYYTTLLNDELKTFLTPWLWDKNGEDHFGNSVFESRILSFVQNRAYVDFVTGFSVVKTINDEGIMELTDTASDSDMEEIKSTYPWSILVSADEHDIQIIKKETYIEPQQRSITNMVIGSDFIITQ